MARSVSMTIGQSAHIPLCKMRDLDCTSLLHVAGERRFKRKIGHRRWIMGGGQLSQSAKDAGKDGNTRRFE